MRQKRQADGRVYAAVFFDSVWFRLILRILSVRREAVGRVSPAGRDLAGRERSGCGERFVRAEKTVRGWKGEMCTWDI